MSALNKPTIKAVIATNHRIYIVDKTLAILQNVSLLQNQTRLKVRSLVLLDQTVLFASDAHIHYLT